MSGDDAESVSARHSRETPSPLPDASAPAAIRRRRVRLMFRWVTTHLRWRFRERYSSLVIGVQVGASAFAARLQWRYSAPAGIRAVRSRRVKEDTGWIWIDARSYCSAAHLP